VADITVTGQPVDRGAEILTREALAFVADLQQRFGPRRDDLIAERAKRRAEIASAGRLDFLPSTKEIRDAECVLHQVVDPHGTVAPQPGRQVLKGHRDVVPQSALGSAPRGVLHGEQQLCRDLHVVAPAVELHNGVTLEDTGQQVTRELVVSILDQEGDAIRAAIGDDAFATGRFQEASELFEQVAVADEFVDLLTLPAYDIVA
jgi:malate synthase